MVSGAKAYKGEHHSLPSGLDIDIDLLFPAEDEAAAGCIAMNNGLESYAYNLRNRLANGWQLPHRRQDEAPVRLLP